MLTLAESSWWEDPKVLIPVIAAVLQLCGVVASYFIPLRVFKNQRRLAIRQFNRTIAHDRAKRTEDRQLEVFDHLKSAYADYSVAISIYGSLLSKYGAAVRIFVQTQAALPDDPSAETLATGNFSTKDDVIAAGQQTSAAEQSLLDSYEKLARAAHAIVFMDPDSLRRECVQRYVVRYHQIKDVFDATSPAIDNPEVLMLAMLADAFTLFQENMTAIGEQLRAQESPSVSGKASLKQVVLPPPTRYQSQPATNTKPL